MAICSILVSFLLLWGLTAITDVSPIVQFLVALIGLGVSIDYALLIVVRWREEREKGLEGDEAVCAAMGTAGPRRGLLGHDRRGRPARADRAAAAVPAQHGLRRAADPAGGDARRDHPAAGDPRDDRAAARPPPDPPPRPQPRASGSAGRRRVVRRRGLAAFAAAGDPRRAAGRRPPTSTSATPTRTRSPRRARPRTALDGARRLGHRQGRDRADRDARARGRRRRRSAQRQARGRGRARRGGARGRRTGAGTARR